MKRRKSNGAAGARKRRPGKWAHRARVAFTGLMALGAAGFLAAIAASQAPINAAPAAAVVGGGPDAGAGGDGGVAALRPIVKITFNTVPNNAKAEIWLGKKRLGVIKNPRKPFILERPRDSGPIDIVVKAEGFLPVHTRAYTFNDSKMFVRLTPETDKHTLFGFRREIPDGGADGGGTMQAATGDAGAPPIAPVGPAPAPPAGLVPAGGAPAPR